MPGDPGHRRYLSVPGIVGQDRDHARCALGRRAWFGIGAAWFEREHLALGLPFPPLRERFERLEETLQIALQMWSPDNGPYHGRHYQLQETLCVPQPLSRPRLPILIGGGGEKKTLRLVAQCADACNIPGDAATVAAKLEVLRGHCVRLGRDYDAIKKTANVHYQQDSGKLLAELASLAAVGVESAILTNVDLAEEQFFETLATCIVPQAAGFFSRLAAAAR